MDGGSVPESAAMVDEHSSEGVLHARRQNPIRLELRTIEPLIGRQPGFDRESEAGQRPARHDEVHAEKSVQARRCSPTGIDRRHDGWDERRIDARALVATTVVE